MIDQEMSFSNSLGRDVYEKEEEERRETVKYVGGVLSRVLGEYS